MSADVAAEGPRRASLLQARSRETRKALVRAALELWAERGFERGIEETTVAEIAKAAGVTKGTFYFHFARKEDVLRELGWRASEALRADAHAAMEAGKPLDEVLDAMLRGLARRVNRVDPVAVRRSLADFWRRPTTHDPDAGHVGFHTVFHEVLTHAKATGEVPEQVDADELASILSAVTVDAILAWTSGRITDLAEAFIHRTGLIVAGVRALGGTATAEELRARSG